MPTYTTAELLEVSGLTEPRFKDLCQRGQFRPSGGRNGTGKRLQHTRMDVLQAALIVRLGLARIMPKRSAMLWRVIDAHDYPPTLCIVLDGDAVRLVSEADAPYTGEVISLRNLMREIGNRLYQIDSFRVAADPTAYPFRAAFAAPDASAAWSVFLADEVGEPDGETIARLCDATEARSHLLIAASSQAALDCVAAAVRRMLETATAEPIH